MGDLKHFILFYRPHAGVLVEIKEFDDSAAAAAALADAERESLREDRDDTERDLQVVMLSAATPEVLHETHPHYFKPSSQESVDKFAFA